MTQAEIRTGIVDSRSRSRHRRTLVAIMRVVGNALHVSILPPRYGHIRKEKEPSPRFAHPCRHPSTDDFLPDIIETRFGQILLHFVCKNFCGAPILSPNLRAGVSRLDKSGQFADKKAANVVPARQKVVTSRSSLLARGPVWFAVQDISRADRRCRPDNGGNPGLV